MPPAHTPLRVWFPALVTLSVLAPLAAPDSAFAQNSPNVRPFVDVGYSQPVEYFDFDQGYGFGFGFEMEQSRRVSMLLRIEWNLLSGPVRYYPSPYLYGYEDHSDLTTMSWSLGPRIHLIRRATFRPFVDLGLGVRLGDEASTYYLDDASGSYRSARHKDGLVAIAGLGVTTARYRSGGMTLSVGIEAPFSDPERFFIVPARLGVVFP
jgi:hypothetical protein